MCCCLCPSLHRHQIHLISYGCVSFGLITTGLVFTVFAIFQKDSQIGKVWLAGPTTMVVGLVLCGKVMIDWGPAMLHAREGSIDSRLMDTMANSMAVPSRSHAHTMRGGGNIRYETRLDVDHSTANDCLIYSQYEPPPTRHLHQHTNNVNLNGGAMSSGPKRGAAHSAAHSPRRASRRASLSSPVRSPQPPRSPSTPRRECECYAPPPLHMQMPRGDRVERSEMHTHIPMQPTQYGSIRRPLFQGESFVLNERNYLI